MLTTLAVLAALLAPATAGPIQSRQAAGIPKTSTLHPAGSYDWCLWAMGIGENDQPDPDSTLFSATLPVVIRKCSACAPPNQVWTVQEGNTYIRLAGTNWCLDAGSVYMKGYQPTNGALAHLEWCPMDNINAPNPPPTGSTWNHDGARFHQLGQGQSFYLDLKDGNFEDNSPVQLWEDANNENQYWVSSQE